jgi:hypothetical protein
MKYLGINSTTKVKDLYNKNYKAQKKETEEDTRRWKDLQRSSIGRINIVKNGCILKAIYIFSAISIKILMKFIREVENSIVNFIWKHEKP